VKIGTVIEVKILRVDTAERKIGLSKKRAEWAADQEHAGDSQRPRARRGGLIGPGEVSTDLIEPDILFKPSPAKTPAEQEEATAENAPAEEADAVSENAGQASDEEKPADGATPDAQTSVETTTPETSETPEAPDEAEKQSPQ
jgi:small subunit ribosomal protein S1